MVYRTVMMFLLLKWTCFCFEINQEICANGENEEVSGTELLFAFVVFRHGDRTPGQKSAQVLYPKGPQNITYQPYGFKALTNSGKRRAYEVGRYIRCRYAGFLSADYRPGELVANTTNVDRTKMSVLVALAAIYPPRRDAIWKEGLPWQPVPYGIDDLEAVNQKTCSKFIRLMEEAVSSSPELRGSLKSYEGVLKELSYFSGGNITTPLYAFLLRAVILGQQSYGIEPPPWFHRLRDKIEQISNFQMELSTYNDDLVRLFGGVQLTRFLDETSRVSSGRGPRAALLSAHEATVAGALAAARAFTPHVPHYGAVASLELRRRTIDGRLVVAVVYAPEPALPGRVLHVRGCGRLCELSTFTRLTSPVRISREQFDDICGSDPL